MRIFGHPVHVMLVHFPVALWPAHECIHLFASQLPKGAAASVGFWLLLSGTISGWLAAFFGLNDLVALTHEKDRIRFLNGIIHAVINGTVLLGFTVIAVSEYRTFPVVVHGGGFLIGEAVLLSTMLAGNFFGGAVIWQRPA